jgi:hypothetical protein
VPSCRVIPDDPKDLTCFVFQACWPPAAARPEPARALENWAATSRLSSGLPGSVTGAPSRGWVPGSACRRPPPTGYLHKVIEVPGEKAPGLREPVERALAEGTPYVILGGKGAGTGRCHEKTTSRKGAETGPWYSGKKHDFGGNINARARNALIRSVRCLAERGFALLTRRRQTLQHVTMSPGENRPDRTRRPRPDAIRARNARLKSQWENFKWGPARARALRQPGRGRPRARGRADIVWITG